MWQISTSPPRFADKRLASLKVESQTDRSTADQLILHVALWCGRVHDRIKIDNTIYRLSFGFRVGEVVVEPSGGQIRNRPRLKTVAVTLRIRQYRIETIKRIVSAAGKIGAQLSQWFGPGTVKAAVNLEGRLDKRYFEDVRIGGEFRRNVWRVADAGYNFWRVFGLGLNPEGVLENKLIGDEPLCHIGVEKGKKSVDVDVSFRCNTRDDLWFQVEEVFRSRVIAFFFHSRVFWILNCLLKWRPQDCRFKRDQEALLRSKVAKTIVNKALKPRGRDSVATTDGELIILARQKMHAQR